MIRKQLPGLIIAPRVGQLGILGGVLDILMPHPILYKAQLSAGVKQVCRDGMLEHVEFPFIRGQTSLFAVGLHGAS
jgi:hypothetical protein